MKYSFRSSKSAFTNSRNCSYCSSESNSAGNNRHCFRRLAISVWVIRIRHLIVRPFNPYALHSDDSPLSTSPTSFWRGGVSLSRFIGRVCQGLLFWGKPPLCPLLRKEGKFCNSERSGFAPTATIISLQKNHLPRLDEIACQKPNICLLTITTYENRIKIELMLSTGYITFRDGKNIDMMSPLLILYK